MKKQLTILFTLLTLSIFGQGVTQQAAKTVALNYFNQNSVIPAIDDSLVYVKKDSTNHVNFYVFNMINTKGFVAVTAYNNIEPVIAYSNESAFDTTGINKIGLSDWINTTSNRISVIQRSNIVADNRIQNLWSSYLANVNPNLNSRTTTVSPLLQTTWSQGFPYNELCPFNIADNQRCVVGCVATAMSQIMKYWSYPTQGVGSYSYIDAPPYYSRNYGLQSANFGNTIYNWTNMPNNATVANNDLATLNYHCGVSVGMDYGDYNEGGSGAWVMEAESQYGVQSAQHSYYTYFGYNPSTIQAVWQANYTSTAWISLIQNELNNGRPVQYQGAAVNVGHTWVCDGYQSDQLFHMNWGWGGNSNGYFSLSNLVSAGYVWNQDDAALIGIQPYTNPGCNAPSAPTSSNVTVSSATLTWAGAANAINYNIQYRPLGDTTWRNITSSSTTYNLSGLTGATIYEWHVKSICSNGDTYYSTINKFWTLGGSCSTPILDQHIILSAGLAIISWNNVYGAESYTMEYRRTIDTAWIVLPPVQTNSTAISYLTNSTSYNFRVKTNCFTGMYSGYATGSFTTLAGFPCATPANLQLHDLTNTTFTPMWDYTNALLYTFRYKSTDSTNWNIITTTGTALYDIGILAGKTYECQIMGTCDGQINSPWSTPALTFTSPLCAAPVYYASASITSTSVWLYWSNISSITNFVINYRVQGTTSWNTLNSTNLSIQLTGLSPATIYEWRVSTNCTNGATSVWGTTQTFTTSPCNSLTNFQSVTLVGGNNAQFQWNYVEGATGYNLRYKPTSSTTWTTISVNQSQGTVSYYASNLLSNENYEFQVQTKCGAGVSSFTASTYFTTLNGCSSPWNNSAVVRSDNSVLFSWASDNVISYTIQWRKLGDSAWTQTVILVGQNVYVSPILLSGTTYQWQMKNNCTSINSSAWSSIQTFTTSGTNISCGLPVNLSTTNISYSTATFNWNIISGATRYNLQWRVQGSTSWNSTNVTSNYCNVTRLTPNTNYEWQVQTYCNGVTSQFTSLIPFTTLCQSVWVCIIPLNGFESDGCGNTRANSACNPCIPTWVCESPLNGYESDGCGNRRTNTACNPPCNPVWVCETPADGYETDGCGNRRINTNCNAPIVYCTSSGTTSKEYIKNVTVGTINNTTGASSSGYSNYTNLNTNITGNSTASIKLTPAFTPTRNVRKEYWNVYVDYNHNGSFEDIGEKVVSFSATTNSSTTKTFTIPSSALNGQARMRVQMKYNSYPTNSCSVFSYGEVEDYTITINGNLQSVMPDSEEDWYKVFPNPSNGQFTIQGKGELNVQIFNISGQRVFEDKCNEECIIETKLEKGVYVIFVNNKSYKLIID